MGFLRFAQLWPALFAAAVLTTLLVGTPRSAHAQTLSISMTGITREQPLRRDPTGRFKVSRADCLADDVISFPLIVGSYGGTNLQVWATQSTDTCITDISRNSASASCWMVYSNTPGSTTITVPIRVQDIAQRPPPPITDGRNLGTVASCDSTTSTAQPVTLWFMFVSGSAQLGASASWPTTVDLLGPAPPAIESVGAGNTLLKLFWTMNSDPDILGYKVFCENMGSSTGVITVYEAGTIFDSSGGTTCPDAGTGTGTVDDAGDDADDASDDAGGAATDAATDACTPGTGGGSTGGTSDCGSVLVEGKVLTPEQMAQFSCSDTTGTRAESATMTGLTNFERYAVAVVSSDIVENVGALSVVKCGTPQPVNGFDEVYRSAGGTAGGASFCSLGLRSAAARAQLWPAAAFAAAVALRHWRRRPRRGEIQR